MGWAVRCRQLWWLEGWARGGRARYEKPLRAPYTWFSTSNKLKSKQHTQQKQLLKSQLDHCMQVPTQFPLLSCPIFQKAARRNGHRKMSKMGLSETSGETNGIGIFPCKLLFPIINNTANMNTRLSTRCVERYSARIRKCSHG